MPPPSATAWRSARSRSGSGTGFAVLPGVAEVGDHRGDAARRGAAQRVDDDQQLHQMVVRRERRRLDHEHVGAAHVFLDLDPRFTVFELPDHRAAQVQMQMLRNLAGKGNV